MKLLILSSVLVLSFSQPSINTPSMQFDFLVQNKGSIIEGSKCVFKFPFQNVGSTPLIISVRSSCGCLVPWWNSEPVLPGEWDTVYAQYDTKRLGNFYKTLTVVSQGSETPNTVLYVKGEVLPREVKGLLVFQDDEILPTIPNRQNHIFIDPDNMPEKLSFWNYSDASLELHIVERTSGLKKRVQLDSKALYELRLSNKHPDFFDLDLIVFINETIMLHFIKKISK